MPVPFAYVCIRKKAGETYCCRDVNESKEFVFTAAEHALEHYVNSNTLRACADCVQECKFRRIGGKMSSGHMATQGLENDK